MSIRPVDLQTMIPKNIRLSQENQWLNNKERMEHQNLVMADKKNVENQLQRVNAFEKKDHPKIKNQERHKGKHGGDQPSRDDGKQEKEEKNFLKDRQKSADGKGIKIDITI